jgi:hypothetical protein
MLERQMWWHEYENGADRACYLFIYGNTSLCSLVIKKFFWPFFISSF